MKAVLRMYISNELSDISELFRCNIKFVVTRFDCSLELFPVTSVSASFASCQLQKSEVSSMHLEVC